MAIFLREDDVTRLLPINEAIEMVEQGFKEQVLSGGSRPDGRPSSTLAQALRGAALLPMYSTISPSPTPTLAASSPLRAQSRRPRSSTSVRP